MNFQEAQELLIGKKACFKNGNEIISLRKAVSILPYSPLYPRKSLFAVIGEFGENMQGIMPGTEVTIYIFPWTEIFLPMDENFSK